MDQLLTRRQAELVAIERTLILRVRDQLAGAEGARDDIERLARLVNEMDELFLLVVAGEYNAGKSTFINALLGDEVFAMGDLPTTREISILRHGEAGPPQRAGKHTLVYRYPLDVLRDLEIVDTPGTNSLERMEEAVTRDFVPGSRPLRHQPPPAADGERARFPRTHPGMGEEGDLRRQRRRSQELGRADRSCARVHRARGDQTARRPGARHLVRELARGAACTPSGAGRWWRRT
jgi:hypothetical protein